MSLVWILWACSPSETAASVDDTRPVRDTAATTLDTGDTRTSVETAHTGTPVTASTGDTAGLVDCGVLPKVSHVVSTGYTTEEDFDFDPRGFLVSQRNQNIEGLDRYGNTWIYAANVGADPSGLRVLASGDLAVAQPDRGDLMMVSAKTGGHGTALSGLTFPNGLTADRLGYAFVSEYTRDGRVRQVDVYTGEQWAVAAHLEQPNGLAFSPDESVLYVAEGKSGGRILAIDRLGDTSWSTPRVFFAPPRGTFLTLAVDVCGNVYTVDYGEGDVYRITPDGLSAEVVTSLGTGGYSAFSAIRFGNGVGGWERDMLYVTRRAELFEVGVGIDGQLPVY